MKRLLVHIRRNAVAYVALFVALGGTSYAAFDLPNHSIDPVKFDPKFINGSVRAWAIVGPRGKVIAGAGKPQANVTAAGPGFYNISWGVRLGRNCATTATIDGNHSPITEQLPPPGNPGGSPLNVTAGYAVANSASFGPARFQNRTGVVTFNQQGKLTALAFDVAVIC